MKAPYSWVIPVVLLVALSLIFSWTGTSALGARSLPPSAPRPSVHRANADVWADRDETMYVVSTINLLSPLPPDDLSQRLHDEYGVLHYAVFQDRDVRDLYFIRLQRAEGITLAVLTYRIGWRVPMAVTNCPAPLHAAQAPPPIVREYGIAPLELTGVQTSLYPL